MPVDYNCALFILKCYRFVPKSFYYAKPKILEKMIKNHYRILYLDDDVDFFQLIKTILLKDQSAYYDLVHVQSHAQFLQYLENQEFDLVISDFDLKDFTGFDVLETVQKTRPDLPVIIVTGSGSEEIAVECMKKGASDYIIKNFEHIKKLPFAIKSVYEKAELLKETQQKDQSLRQAHAELKLIMETIASAIVILDQNFTILQYNPYAYYFFNLSPHNEISGLPISRLIHDEKFNECLTKFSENDEQQTRFEISLPAKAENRHFLIMLHKYDRDQRFLLIAVDLTDRKKMEEELILYRKNLEKLVEQKAQRLLKVNKELVENYQKLQKLETKLRQQQQEKINILDNLNEALIFIDPQDKIKWLNRAACQVFESDRNQCTGNSFETLSTPGLSLKEILKNGNTEYPVTFEFNDQAGRWWDIKIIKVKDEKEHEIGTLVTLWEITEIKKSEEARKRIENQLFHKHKLESIGTLASGVAHEINNPMTGIINYAKLLRNRISDQNLKSYAEGIIEEGERISLIVKSLLAFSRKEQPKLEKADLRRLVESSVHLIRSIMRKEHVHIQIDFPDDFPTVACRPQQIQQVLINLLTNAVDALREKSKSEKKQITISGRLVDDAQDMVQLIIEDNGTGIPEEIVDRIYDPFFSTKPRDLGTGLGLSVSYGIIERHGGQLRCESEKGKFTRFYIELPLQPEEKAEELVH